MPPAARAGDDLFERHDVAIGSTRDPTVLTGFLLGGAMAELAVVDIDENGDRHLRIYAFADDSWTPRLDAVLRQGVLFVDLANIGGRDRLITYESGRLNWFDPDSATEHSLIRIAADYRAIGEDRIPRVDITRDLNHDGRDDLIVPDVDGFWIATQLSDGSFSEAMKLGPPEPYASQALGNLDVGEPAADGSRSYGDVGITAVTTPLYLSRVHELDYDLDGRSDLVFWNEDHFDVHRQDERGLFEPLARTLPVDVPFDGEGAYARAFDYRDRGLFSTLFGLGAKSRRTVLHSLRDINGDQVADLTTLTLAGRSITKQRSIYQVHFGRLTADGVRFAREADASVFPRGRAGGLQPWGYSSQWFRDFDGDGRVDIMFRDVKVGIGGMARALVGNSVPLDLELYRGEDGAYGAAPTTRRRIRRFAPFAGLGNVFLPPVLMGDVNGDGRSDLLVGVSPKELRVFPGVPGPDLLARTPLKVAIDLPPDEQDTRLVDLNRDDKRDLLIHHGPTDHAPNRPHRVTMLLAR